MSPENYYLGWDVGGWNCDHNPNSRDAIVILDQSLHLVGTPWRGNLRKTINEAGSTREFLEALFRLNQATLPEGPVAVILAIDTPLGFSEEFRALVNNLGAVGEVGKSQDNPYLFRQSEFRLFKRGWKPLSPVKDMIGSQATKGMHVLGRFAPRIERCGVWTDGAGFRAIESYPTVCREAASIKALRSRINQKMPHSDIEDALTCALLASLFVTEPDSLEAPYPEVPVREGWIWVPKE